MILLEYKITCFSVCYHSFYKRSIFLLHSIAKNEADGTEFILSSLLRELEPSRGGVHKEKNLKIELYIQEKKYV
jgi:hypothetical protein